MKPTNTAFWTVSTVVVYAAGLLGVGALRYSAMHADDPPAIAEYATVLYIALTVFAAMRLNRLGVPLQRFGFALTLRTWRLLALALVALAVVQLAGYLLGPVWEGLFGASRDLSRFSDVEGSTGALIQLLLFSWTFAAFGEEFAFRILLMRGLAHALGGSSVAVALALVLQAVVFGVIHAYQGPAGIAGAATSGLVYGAVTIAARGSIWPAAIAHGLNNTIGILQIYTG